MVDAGALCGESAFGLNSIYSVEMVATADLADFLDINDGVVRYFLHAHENSHLHLSPM